MNPTPPPAEIEQHLAAIRARTPARLWAGRVGTAYRTSTALELRADHAAARDAVLSEIDLQRDFPAECRDTFQLFEVQTEATSKNEYLIRPDKGRTLSHTAREMITARCERSVDLQIIIGDGLSATAVRSQVPTLLPLLHHTARAQGWRIGQPFFVRYCRVGVLNEIGPLLNASVNILLIGERPGLATAESLSAYMAFRPHPGHTDAQRNLISNIHARGVNHADAVRRILALAAQMRAHQSSGVDIKEQDVHTLAPHATPLPHHPQ